MRAEEDPLTDRLTDPTGITRRRRGRHRAPVTGLRRLLLRAGDSLRNSRRQCRTGHRYDEALPVGGGILRSSCTACGHVSLDLREAGVASGAQLFANGDGRSFAILRRKAIPPPWPPLD